jgi:hypothetical protein
MSARSLLLLAAPSRESRDKALHFADAAAALGLPSRTIVTGQPEQVAALAGDDAILFALACSDALALPAAQLNARHGCSGLSPQLIGTLADKATGIPWLSRRLGLPLLPQCLPQTPEDIARWSWSGRVIVKPTRSAGGWSPRPWGYRIFDSKADLLHWLRAESLEATFFAEQQRPGLLGPALLQAALDTARTEAVLILLTPSRLQVLCRPFGEFETVGRDAGDIDTGGLRWRRVAYGGAAAPELVAQLGHLEAGAGRGLLYLQALRGPDGLYLIDINPRLSSGWDWMATAVDPSAHRRLLAALLFDQPFDAALVAPAVAIDLVHGDSGRNLCAIDHPPLPPHIRPLRLTPEACGAADATSFDRAATAPAFVTLAPDLPTCIARAEAFRAGIALQYATETAA